MDYRAYLRPADEAAAPIALFFQVKHSHTATVGNKVTLESLLNWYQRCSTALSKVGAKFRVGLVFVTNREVDMPDATAWPENLLVISQSELAQYLGPLAHRGLLATE